MGPKRVPELRTIAELVGGRSQNTRVTPYHRGPFLAEFSVCKTRQACGSRRHNRRAGL